jgi:DNA-binding beta-propeller fold protein YncE
MTFISDDHGNGTFIMPHQAEPDTRAPEVNAVSPRNGVSAQPTLSRIGISFTDQIDLGSLHASSIVLRPVSGGDPVPGIYSVQTNLVSFSPARRLRPNTQYELLLPAGGVKDISGNALAQEFRSVFTTGASRTDLAPCELEGLEPATVASAVSFPLPRVPEDASVTWTLGDSSAPVKFEEPQSASHAYSAAGRYTVRFEAKRGEESVSCSAVQIIHAPLLQDRPRQTSSVAIDSETGWAWTVNPDQNSVSAIDLQTGERMLEIPVGLHPRTLALDQRGRVFVVSQDSALLTVLDSSSGRKLQERALPRGSRPYGVVVSHEGNTIAVTLEDLGEIAFLDAQSLEILARKPTGASPRAMALGPDGRLFVARFISSDLGGEIREWDIHTFQPLGVHALAIDQTPDGEDKGRGLPNYVTGIAMTPDGARLFAPSKKDNILRGKFRDGQALTFENSVRTIVSQLVIADPSNVREDLAIRRDLNDRDSAVAVVFSPAGDLAYVATQGSNTVEVLDTQSGALLTAVENTGLAPQGLALSKDGHTLVVQNFLSRDLLLVDVSGLATGQGTPYRVLKRAQSVSRETLAADVLLGKQIFYNARDRRMSRDSYISCASCHVDGGHDGRTWDFTDRGEGFRNTTTLLGRSGMGHGRVHWSANFDEIQDFENDIRGGFGGTGFLKDSDWLAGTRSDTLGDRKAGLSPELDALSAYVTSLSKVGLSPYREQDGALSSAAKRGQQAFERLQCATCHSGSSFTDSAAGKLHDVGTVRDSSGLRRGERITGIDTPTLQGVWASGPYLHDGSAQGLDQAIEHGLKNREASTEERSDLIRYLLEIEGDTPKAPEAPQPPPPPSGPTPPMSAWIRNLTVTGKPWSQVALAAGQKLYLDRKFVVRSFPMSLQGAALLQTHNEDKTSNVRVFASFTLTVDAWVVIAFDERASTLPQWLQDWEQLTGKMLTDDTGRNLYRKRFSAGERITLGGNAQAPMRGAGSHYQVIVLP